MDQKSVKKLLVETREAIKTKDFLLVKRNCQEILKEDSNNYNALVFSGIASQEMQDFEQAEITFRKAIAVSPNQLLAWQALRSFYESESTKHVQDLIDVYIKFLDFYKGDEEKLIDNVYRLAVTYYKNENFMKAFENLKNALKMSGTELTTANVHLWTTLALWLSAQSQISTEDLETLTNAITKIIEGKKCNIAGLESWNIDSFEKYVEFLVKEQHYQRLLDLTTKLATIFPDNQMIAKWKLQAYISSCVDGSPIILEEFDKLCDAIPEEDSEKHAYVLMAKGSLLFVNHKWVEARDYFLKGLKNCSVFWEGWLLLCWTLERMHDGLTLERCATEGLKVIHSSVQEPKRSNVKYQFQLCLGKGFLYQESSLDIDKCIAALEIAASNPKLKVESLYLQGVAYLKLQSWSEAEMILEKLRQCENDSADIHKLGLEGILCCEQNNLELAKEKLVAAIAVFTKNSDWLLQLGIVYWKSQEPLVAYDYFLKSAKVDPYNATTFLMLARYYEQITKELRKAQRCYQVAHDLDRYNDEIGICLSSICQSLNDEEANWALLSSVTSTAPAGRCKWAWLRLGLLHLRQENPDFAVRAFQAALRADPQDRECWQCLAEAYLLRGSHTAALKAFGRALEIEPQILYCTYQVANIKLTLGLHKEAAAVFQEIVNIVPCYVPALKGLGESYVSQARSYLRSNLSGEALRFCEMALDPLTRALSLQTELTCLWKLLGDALTLSGRMSRDVVSLKVPSTLLRGYPTYSSDVTIMDQKGVLEVGARCYLAAIRWTPNNADLWHDIGVNCYYQASAHCVAEEKMKYFNKSMIALKKAISLRPNSASHWNVLGVVAATLELKDYRLAQHAFIKAVKVEHNNSIAWTNLGTLYLINGNQMLANQAFTIAQSIEPSYVNSWIGQATIAEAMLHEDSMDLFRHCTSLGDHEEGLIGYASWVCSTLLNSSLHQTEVYRYNIEQMAAVPAATDSLFHYIDIIRDNPCAYNMLGLLLEWQGLFGDSRNFFKKALRLLQADSEIKMCDLVSCNYARVLRKLGLIDLAIAEASSVKESEFYNHCGLAACYYQMGNLEESGSVYESALQWLANTDEEKSHLMVAMAAMAYKLRGPDEAKTLLFESFQMKPVCIQGLLALCALGTLLSDATLISAALVELKPWSDDERFRTDIVYLQACWAILQNDIATARNLYCKAIHMWPSDWCIWKLLATYLMQHSSLVNLAAYCISAAVKISCSPTLEILQLLAICKTLSSSEIEGFSVAKTIIHCYPGENKNWYFLVDSFKHLFPSKEFLTKLQNQLSVLS